MRATGPVHHILLDSLTLFIFHKEYTLCSCSYATFSSLLLVPPAEVQIISPAHCCQTFWTCVLPFGQETEFHAHKLWRNCFPISVYTSSYFSSKWRICELRALNLNHRHVFLRPMFSFVSDLSATAVAQSVKRRTAIDYTTWVTITRRTFEFASSPGSF
jgi:hypothetical protein